MITDDDLTRWEELAAGATEGPWRTGNHRLASDFHHGAGTVMNDERVLLVGNSNFDCAADAALAAEARTAVPALVAEVRRLRGVDAEIGQTLNRLQAAHEERDALRTQLERAVELLTQVRNGELLSDYADEAIDAFLAEVKRT